MKKVRIISRNSKLAMWQAEHVQQQLHVHYPTLEVEIIGITTEGDRILDQSLEKIGGKGLFIKELERQLLTGTVDIAVHSLKDLPANLSTEFKLAAVLPRENPFDALVSNNYKSLEEIPKDSVIGTSSARRVAILKRYYPHLHVKLLRGNLQTRLAKLDNGEYDAIILAVAGLKRLGLSERIAQVLPADKFIPAIGQGALAIEICHGRDDLRKLLEPLNDVNTAMAIGAEREMGRYLNASCNIPIAGFAQIIDNKLRLTALIADVECDEYLDVTSVAEVDDFIGLGKICANELLAKGAASIINKYNH